MVGDRVVESRQQQLLLSKDVFLGYLFHADARILLAEYGHVDQMSNASFDRDVDDVCLSRLAVGKGVGGSQHQLFNALESSQKRVAVEIIALADFNTFRR